MLALTLALSRAHAAPKDFVCVETTLAEPGYELALAGTLVPLRGRPTEVIVTNVDTATEVLDVLAPRLFNAYDGGYWLTEYGLNTWNLGRSGSTQYFFLLDAGVIGTSFTAELHEVFGPHGSWGWIPLEFDCELL